MNCYIHLDKPAVATCHECGMGLCRDCVDNSIYTVDNRPLCHNCNLRLASQDLANAKSKKTWSLVKFIFGASFLLLGISIYSSTGDVMNAWIYAGIAGIPAAFRSTRDSRREQARKAVRDALTTDMMDSVSNTFIDLLVRIAAIIILAPITATFAAIKNLFVFIGSFGKIKAAQEAYDYLSSEQDIVKEEEPVYEPVIAAPQAAPAAIPDMRQQTGLESETPSPVIVPQPPVPPVTVPQSPAPPANVPQSPAPYVPQGTTIAPASKKANTGVIVGVVVGVLLLVGCIIGYFMWYVPYARDRDALRTYVLANNVFLRSTQMAGVEYNILGKIPYGSELITYTTGSEWASVKVNGMEGYMASPYLLTAADFRLLNGAWGNTDTKECIESSKCRLAILDFYKRNNLASGSSGWQIYTKAKNQKPNNVFYPRLYDRNSKFTDFVFIVKENASGARILACYSFEDETEKPIYRFQSRIVSDGYLQNVFLSYGQVKVRFDDGKVWEVPLQ